MLRISGAILSLPIRHYVVDKDNFIFTFVKNLFGFADFEDGTYLEVHTRESVK
jgi:hypothetical protein